MISTSHILIGAAAGAATGNPIGAFFVGVASHFVMDAIPHSDIGTFRPEERKKTLNYSKSEFLEAWADVLIGMVALVFFVSKVPSADAINLFLGAIGGMSIDVIDNVPYWSSYLRSTSFFGKIHQLHEFIGFDLNPKYWIWGVLTQAIFGGASLFYLLKLSGIMR